MIRRYLLLIGLVTFFTAFCVLLFFVFVKTPGSFHGVWSALTLPQELKQKIKVNICPTLREADGLAMSSRNMRLTAEQRKTSVTIYNCLASIKKKIKPGITNGLEREAIAMVEKAGFKIDYIEIADANNLSPINNWDGKQKIVALIAAFLDEVRLIDNMLLN